MKSLRIGQVGTLWYPIPPKDYGGIELMMKQAIDELVSRGHEVTLFATGDCDTAAKLHHVLDKNFMDVILNGGANMYEYYSSTVVAEAISREREFDIIHFYALPACIPIMSLATTPCLHTYRNPLHVDDEYVLRRFPNVHISGISHSQMAKMSERLSREFPVVYNGCDFSRYTPCFEKGSYLAFLGKMSEVKNPIGAINVAMQARMPIILGGEPTSQKDEIYFKNKVLPLIDNRRVRWIGRVNHAEKVKLLQGAAAMLFPIQWEEAFGNVMIEAMACGTPVVALKRGSVGEVVRPEVSGYYSESLDELPGLIGKAIELDRKAVRQYAKDHFSASCMVDQYLKLYYDIIEQRSRN